MIVDPSRLGLIQFYVAFIFMNLSDSVNSLQGDPRPRVTGNKCRFNDTGRGLDTLTMQRKLQ